MRIMAKVVQIDRIENHSNADRLELAYVGAWQSVVGKGEFQQGELAVYCEIDSFVPHELAPNLTKADRPALVVNGVQGNVLKTVRLRNELSQGFLIPLQKAVEYWQRNQQGSSAALGEIFYQGADVGPSLGIFKYEKPLTEEQKTFSLGYFPSAFPKTDEERVQNLVTQLQEYAGEGLTFEVTEKLEGESMTVFQLDGRFGVCSRTHELRQDCKAAQVQIAHALKLREKMAEVFGSENIAIQGELVGPGIEGNYYALKEHQFMVYKICRYGHDHVSPRERQALVAQLGLQSVPLLETDFELPKEQTAQALLEKAKGTTLFGANRAKAREGLVFKCNERPELSFKAINNDYLLKQKT